MLVGVRSLSKRWDAGVLLLAMLTAGLLSAPSNAAPLLPDGRVPELVSPKDKNFGDVTRVLRASDDGSVVAIGVNGGFAGANGAHNVSFGVARRTATGWTVEPADAAGVPFSFGTGPQGLLPYDFDPGFAHVIDQSDGPLVPEDTSPAFELYRVDVGLGTAAWLTAPEGVALPPDLSPEYGAASSDLSRVYFTGRNNGSTPAPLLPGAPDNALYESRDGSLRVVSKLPDGTSSAGFVAVAAGGRSALAPGVSGVGTPHRGAHAVSDDGSSVFWRPLSTVPAPLYLSQDGQPTRAVSTQPAAFVGATHDHSFAFIASTGQLTPDATSANELYRYDTASGTFSLLTLGAAGGTGAQVTTALASDDMSHLYFTGFGALTPEAQAGSLNAYVWSAGHIRFIATFDDPNSTVLRVSNNGQYALFASQSNLVGATSNGHHEIYAYNVANGDLACASCRSGGAPSEGDASVGEEIDSVPPLGNAPYGLQRARNLTDDGRVFFTSTDALVASDVNGKRDVYEWSPGGDIALLTGGRSEFDSYLGDNSDDGRDVFVLTRTQMVANDTDGLYDAYDLRVGGGFPNAGPAACVADDCQGAGSPQLQLAVPASTHTSGVGNVTPAKQSLVRKRVTLMTPSRTVLRELARRGSARLTAHIIGGGRLVVRGRGAIGGHFGTLAVGVLNVHASSFSSTVRVLVRLSRSGRRELAERGHLVLMFSASLSGAPPSPARRTTLTLNR